jgi:V8-like Glu-specific endopeptidase
MTWAARPAALISVTGLVLAAVSALTVGPASAHTNPPASNASAHSAASAASGSARDRKHTPAPFGGPWVPGHAAAITADEQATVRRYWTRARMEHAIPVRPSGTQVLPPAQPHSTPGQSNPSSRRSTKGRHTGRKVRPHAATPPAMVHTRAAASPAPASAPAVTVPAQAAAGTAPGQQSEAATSGALWNGGGAVARTSGKVFFSMGSNDYVCSGSTVASANADVVITAGHCVKNGTGVWAANWTFVPGYANGNEPYGSFTANQFYVASQWSSQADNDYDVAFVALNPMTQGTTSVPVVHEVGGQGIEFGSQPTQETVFGYPADPPYNGGQLYYCSGAVSPDPYHLTDDNGLTCAMTAGSSGGPWLSGFNPATGTGTITAVSSFKYSTNNEILYGTPLGTTAETLYQAAQSSQ